MNCYDYIIAGAGCAGLSLAYYLSQSQLSEASILIIDREEKTGNDRTWCFWSNEPTAFDAIVIKKWTALSFIDNQYTQIHHPKQIYQLIRSSDFYQYTKSRIQQKPNFRWLQGTVQSKGEDERGAYVAVNGERYYARWVFDSCFSWRDWQGQAEQHQFLWQHFKGWVIETTSPAFTSNVATLMDFRTEQQGSVRFLYVLPFSANKALIEYTIFSTTLESAAVYDKALQNYLLNALHIEDYRITETEQGAIPMTDAPLRWDGKSRIIPIGTLGGAVKPTTGYAFLRIQSQIKSLVKSLEQTGLPMLPVSKSRFRFYDRLLLNILQYEGSKAARIFSDLFRRNEMERVLTFLDEHTTIRQEAVIFAKLPILTFLKAIKRLYFKKNMKMTSRPFFAKG